MITPKQYEKIVGKRIRYDILLKYETATKLIKKYKTNQLKILDIACGHGLIPFFADKNWIIYETDIDENRLKAAQKVKHKNTFYYKFDAENFDFLDKVDVILALDVIEHLNNPEKALKNIYNCLKDDGILIVSNPNRYSLWNILNNLFHLEDHKHYWNPDSFIKMADKFEIMEVLPRPLLSEGIGWFVNDYRKLQNIDSSLGRLLPSFATGWFLVFRKN